MHFEIGIALLVFGVIFLAELPDKSMFAALALGSRLPGLYVWLGAAAAFLVHVVIAVFAGHLLTLLPHWATETAIALLFFAGAMLLLFGNHGIEDALHHDKRQPKDVHNPFKVFATSFGVVFVGEWGDITQIVTANYAAKYHEPLSVAVGATAALWIVAALAITVGARALSIVPAKLLFRLIGVVMLVSAILSAVSAFR
jgi:putative Ca2+/H+ antiporter (TMEM165/GDT1 family)